MPDPSKRQIPLSTLSGAESTVLNNLATSEGYDRTDYSVFRDAAGDAWTSDDAGVSHNLTTGETA